MKTPIKSLQAVQLIFLFAISAAPAYAELYHSNYGNGRVTYQNQIGLYHNDASYVSAGTLGQSARDGGMHNAGINTGSLPTTHWGGYIRNPGDDIYNGNNGAMRQDNGSMVYGDEVAYANFQKRMRAQEQRMQAMMMRMRMRQSEGGADFFQERGNYYVPGSNGAAANYGSGASRYPAYK